MSYQNVPLTAYHPSVRHYHSPFPLEHRNSRPMSGGAAAASPGAARGPPPAAAIAGGGGGGAGSGYHFSEDLSGRTEETLELEAAVFRSYAAQRQQQQAQMGQRSLDPQPSPNRVRQAGHKEHINYFGVNSSGRSADGTPLPPRRVEDSDHMIGPGIIPSSHPATETHRSVIAHSEEALPAEENSRLWFEERELAFPNVSVRKKRRVPYVSREEYVDPLACTSATRRAGCCYVWRSAPKGKMMHGRQMQVPFSSRRAPAHAMEFPEKINWHNPFHYDQQQQEQRRQQHDKNNSKAAGQQHQLVSGRLPATPLLEEVEERLRLRGCGSLVDVRFASDDTISDLLRSCGFSATQQMTILRELRVRFPQVAGPDTSVVPHTTPVGLVRSGNFS